MPDATVGHRIKGCTGVPAIASPLPVMNRVQQHGGMRATLIDALEALWAAPVGKLLAGIC